MATAQHQRPLESGVHRDLEGRLNYADYLCLDRLLSAQNPLASCAWIHVRHILSVLQCAAVGKVSGDAGRAEGVITDRRVNAGSMVARPALAVKSLDCTNDPHQGR
jgi:hypothetical protein